MKQLFNLNQSIIYSLGLTWLESFFPLIKLWNSVIKKRTKRKKERKRDWSYRWGDQTLNAWFWEIIQWNSTLLFKNIIDIRLEKISQWSLDWAITQMTSLKTMKIFNSITLKLQYIIYLCQLLLFYKAYSVFTAY